MRVVTTTSSSSMASVPAIAAPTPAPMPTRIRPTCIVPETADTEQQAFPAVEGNSVLRKDTAKRDHHLDKLIFLETT